MLEGSDLSHHFGVNNIPFGVASSPSHAQPQCVTRIANTVIFLGDIQALSQDDQIPSGTFSCPTLNKFASLGREVQENARQAVQKLVMTGSLPPQSQEPIANVQMHLPLSIGDYTDFSCSSHHNRNAGQALLGMARNLPPAYDHHPLGYAGRCSSIQISGDDVRRPSGLFFEAGHQGISGEDRTVTYAACRAMDYELEMAAFIGKPVEPGDTVTAVEANEHIFGYVVLNDWSARDIQQLEMIPVGPLISKSTATSISPWVILPGALSPFTYGTSKPGKTPAAKHLARPSESQLHVQVSVLIDGKLEGQTDVDEMDWSFEQIVAHQSSGGCGLRTGDLLAIGTISGPGDREQGCLLERFVPGASPGRGYLEDGEEVCLLGYCGDGVGFGECRAKLLPAHMAAH